MSLANYVIICRGRIAVATSRNGFEQICAASDTAAMLLSHIELRYPDRLTKADTLPISDLQHEMMDLVSGRTMARTRQQPNSASEMVDEMFALLDALEQKMET